MVRPVRRNQDLPQGLDQRRSGRPVRVQGRHVFPDVDAGVPCRDLLCQHWRLSLHWMRCGHVFSNRGRHHQQRLLDVHGGNLLPRRCFRLFFMPARDIHGRHQGRCMRSVPREYAVLERSNRLHRQYWILQFGQFDQPQGLLHVQPGGAPARWHRDHWAPHCLSVLAHLAGLRAVGADHLQCISDGQQQQFAQR